LKGQLSQLSWLEAESIHILREAVAEAERPVMLFSAGKDSTVLAHLALRAFFPSKPPFPLLHIDSTWEFRSLIEFRDSFARTHGFTLIAHANEDGRAAGINPFDYGDRYTLLMRTEPLKAALDHGKYDVIFGGARRDEERSRAKERIVSVRSDKHVWDPRQQRPEFWRQFNLRLGKGQSARVFPLSNWTEADLWDYVLMHKIELAPLYFAAPRSVVERKGSFVVIDDESRMRFLPGESVVTKTVRFRTLGCWPVTGAIESEAADIETVVEETLRSKWSERQGRISDGEDGGSLEQKKREGYF
jgi:sulfate adenylyltransferase subunit 2